MWKFAGSPMGPSLSANQCGKVSLSNWNLMVLMWTASLCYFRFELWSLMAASSTLLALSWAMGRFDILSGSMFACNSSGSLLLNAQLYPQGDKNRSSGRSLGGLWLLSPWPPGTVQHLTLVWQWLIWWLPFCLWVSHWWWNMIHLWLRMPWWNWSCWRWNHCCCWGPHCGCCWCCPLVPLLPDVLQIQQSCLQLGCQTDCSMCVGSWCLGLQSVVFLGSS